MKTKSKADKTKDKWSTKIRLNPFMLKLRMNSRRLQQEREEFENLSPEERCQHPWAK